ncbi:DNA gyrase inhibitor YacG [Comamonadaceae bacterium PP-2]
MSATESSPSTPFAQQTVKCPGCGEQSVYATSNPYRPFCSARCKNFDLGAWANEEFRVQAVEHPEDDGETEGSTATPGLPH